MKDTLFYMYFVRYGSSLCSQWFIIQYVPVFSDLVVFMHNIYNDTSGISKDYN